MVTKHYYNGSERIVSRLAGSVNLYTEDINLSDTHLDTLPLNQTSELNYLETELNLNPIVQIEADTTGDCEVSGTCASVLYFFHPDHLGSSTFLSDETGQAYQFLLYLPWGESMAEQKAGGYSTPYKYTGKELDTDIGMYDYGARFYDPSLSLWTSVDPLTEKMPQWSPYNYTFNNPIIYNDPDGREPGNPITGLIGKAKSYAISKVKEIAYNAAASLYQSAVDYVDNWSYEAKVEGNITAGWQAGGGVEGVYEKMVNVGNVELVGVQLGVKISTEGLENTSEMRYIGEDGDVNYSQKYAGSASIGYVGGSTEIKNEGTMNVSSNGIRVTDSDVGGEFGPSVGPINATYGTGKKNGVGYDKVSVGGGVSGALIIGGKVEAKVEITRVDEEF